MDRSEYVAQFINSHLLEDYKRSQLDSLQNCSKNFFQWNDSGPLEESEFADGLHRSIGLKLAARYIQALADAAISGQPIQEKDVEPARWIALALFDAGTGFDSTLFRSERKVHDLAEEFWQARKAPSRLIIEGRAVGCVWFLLEAGNGISTRRAAQFVADSFATMGHTGRKGGRLTGNTVRKWFDEIILATGEKADQYGSSGLALTDNPADKTRQRAAIEAFNELAEQHLREPNLSWLNKAIWKLAAEHSVSATQAALALSR